MLIKISINAIHLQLKQDAIKKILINFPLLNYDNYKENLTFKIKLPLNFHSR